MGTRIGEGVVVDFFWWWWFAFCLRSNRSYNED